LHCSATSLAVAKCPTVYIHPDKLIRQLRIHIARELHGVMQRFLSMFESVCHALADGPRNLSSGLRSQRTPHGIASQRPWQLRRLQPPLTQVHHAMKSQFRELQLSLMDEQAGVRRSRTHGIDDLIEGNRNRLEGGLIKPKR